MINNTVRSNQMQRQEGQDTHLLNIKNHTVAPLDFLATPPGQTHSIPIKDQVCIIWRNSQLHQVS